MRIISGTLRGRKFNTVDSKKTRPTTDRVRENIFNLIGPKIKGALILDVFSGSGAFALESSSRGALKVYANDNNRECIEMISENIRNAKINNIDVFNKDYLDFLNHAKFARWNIIFLDPPYGEKEFYINSLASIVEHNLLKEMGIVVIEHPSRWGVPIPKGLAVYKNKKYGNTTITILSLNEDFS